MDTFCVGDQALVHNTQKTTRKGGKIETKWKGPYRVTKVSGKGIYFLEELKISVIGSRLTIYRTGEDEDDRNVTEGDSQKVFATETKHDVGCEEQNVNSECKDERQLPLKKRKVSNVGDVTVINESVNESVQFKLVDKDWQEQMSKVFHAKVKTSYNTGQDRYISRGAKPTRTVFMHGYGNCLFRTFSYIVFGVQTMHRLLQHVLVKFMKENDNLMINVMRDSVDRYLDQSMMATDDIWGTEVEIFAFATINRTNVYVYSRYGDSWKWLEYKPLSDDDVNSRAVFIQNTGDHFVPVLDVKCEEFSRPPYTRIRNIIPVKYYRFLSDDILDGTLINSHRDEELLRERDKSVTRVYVKEFTNERYNVDGLEGPSLDVGANIFNLVCDWSDVHDLMNLERDSTDLKYLTYKPWIRNSVRSSA